MFCQSQQNPVIIDIQWVATIEYQCWQDSAMIWQEMTKHRKTQLFCTSNKPIYQRDMMSGTGPITGGAGTSDINVFCV